MSFIDILNNEQGSDLVDQIEELIGEEDETLIRIRQSLIDELYDKFGYKYVI